MVEIITEEHVNKLSLEEQVEFYKKYFKYQHCEYNDCGREIRNTWVLRNGELFCEDCFNYFMTRERQQALNEISEYEKKIEELKTKFDLG